MTDQNSNPPAPEPEAQDAAATPESPEADAQAQLAAENTELKERLLRTLAEMDNLRKRTEREMADARSYAVTAFARDLLEVADNLSRALDASRDEGIEAAVALKGLAEGVGLTERELIATLQKHGVVRLDPQGEKFDPHLHQAIFEVPDPSVPAGTVVQVVQTGYTIAGRVLRPAMVGVAKGGPKAPAEPAAGTVDKSA